MSSLVISSANLAVRSRFGMWEASGERESRAWDRSLPVRQSKSDSKNGMSKIVNILALR